MGANTDPEGTRAEYPERSPHARACMGPVTRHWGRGRPWRLALLHLGGCLVHPQQVTQEISNSL